MAKIALISLIFVALGNLDVLSAWPSSASSIHPRKAAEAAPAANAGATKQNFEEALQLQIKTSLSPASSSLQYTRANGKGVPSPMSVLRVGEQGPILLEDFHLLEHLAHFVRERIPERVVHARGSGAHGTFTTTTDFAKNFTVMDVFSEVGLQTPVSVRFSTVGGEQGSADQARDPRGFAIKFRTKKGIWDLVCNNTPVFFLRDPAKFPMFIHTQKRNPQTHVPDPNAVWDYFGQNAESLHQFLRLFSDAGTPKGFVNMDGFTGHAYRWVNKDGQFVYVKIHFVSNQGISNFTAAEAADTMGKDPNFATEDLFSRIESGKFPSWTAFAQVLTPKDAEKFKYNVLDLTKDWPEELVAKHEIGKLELNQNSDNFFAEIEQLAFAPSNVVDGWEISPDPVLQARAFSYADAQRYRLGANFQQLPVNCPINPVVNVQRDGAFGGMAGNQGSRPNYLSTFQSINLPPKPYDETNHTIWTSSAVASLSQVTDIDFEQPKAFYGSLTEVGKTNLAQNVAGSLFKVKYPDVIKTALAVFAKADPDLADRINKAKPKVA